MASVTECVQNSNSCSKVENCSSLLDEAPEPVQSPNSSTSVSRTSLCDEQCARLAQMGCVESESDCRSGCEVSAVDYTSSSVAAMTTCINKSSDCDEAKVCFGLLDARATSNSNALIDAGGNRGQGSMARPVIEAEYTHLEIEDDATNPTLAPCDTGTLKSPGADIDAAELDRGGSVIADLSGCQLIAGPSICENSSSDAANAEGGPDSGGKEATGEYVALNSGKLQCAWSGGADAQTDDKITVYEVGKSAGAGTGSIEQYHVRMCVNAGGNCVKNPTAGAGEVTFLVTDFL